MANYLMAQHPAGVAHVVNRHSRSGMKASASDPFLPFGSTLLHPDLFQESARIGMT
jgi:hypothetical protein